MMLITITALMCMVWLVAITVTLIPAQEKIRARKGK
jgi:hypothetical protein